MPSVLMVADGSIFSFPVLISGLFRSDADPAKEGEVPADSESDKCLR